MYLSFLKKLSNGISFLIPYLLFLLIGSYLLFNYSQAEIFLAINHYHSDIRDLVFSIITKLGDGLFYIAIIIFLLFIKYRYALIGTIGFAILSLITQLVKHTIFEGVERPKKFFEGIENIYLAPGVDVHLYNSFPSGHSATAFSIFCLLALISVGKNKIGSILLGIIYFFIALLAAFSRVYLSQHFFNDIYFGSIIGVSATVVSYLYINFYSRLNSKSWMDKSFKFWGRK